MHFKTIELKKPAVMITIDDIHPESTDGVDCSGDMDNGNFRYLTKLVENFPEIKITLFVTPNWNYKPISIFPHLAISWLNKFRIDKHKEWCNWLREKTKTKNFEIGMHGYTHYQLSYPFQTEFKRLSEREAINRINKSEGLFKKMKLPFIKLFRPPGWLISEESVFALSRKGYFLSASGDTTTSPSPKAVCRITGKGHLIYPHLINDIINITANCDIKRTRLNRIERILKYNGLVILHGHIEDNYHGMYNGNGVNKESYNNLKKIFSFLKKKYSKKINYVGAQDLFNYFVG